MAWTPASSRPHRAGDVSIRAAGLLGKGFALLLAVLSPLPHTAMADGTATDAPGLLEAITGDPIGPTPIIGRMGKPRTGISVSYDNTMMTRSEAEAYAVRDCADYDKVPANLTHEAATPDAPHLAFIRYTCE